MTIEVGKFAKLKNDSMVEYGFSKGDKIFITGSGFVPASKTDPYKYRLVFVATRLVDDHIDLTQKGFTVDGMNLSKVSKKELEVLQANYETDYAPKEDNVTQAEAAETN